MVYRTSPESQTMATKTVISTNMSAARGVSIAIDQDGAPQRGQQIAVGYKQQPPQLDAGKITIYQHSNNKMVTSPTQAAIIRTAGDEEQQQQVSPKSPASSTTFIGLKRHNGDNKSGELERGRNDRDDNDVEEQRRVSSAETGYTTATFPQMLLKVATSERGKFNSNGNGNGQVKEGEDYDDDDEEKSQMNEKGAWNGAGVSVTHGRRESGDANDEADNGVASNMQAAVSSASSVCVRSKRTMIIQCNDADDERADHDVESANGCNHIAHNDDDEQVEHNDDKRCNGNGNHSHSYSHSHNHNHSQSQSNSYVDVDVDVGVGVDDIGENGQNAFDRLAGSGGSGSAGVVDGHRGRQLESVHAAISPNSLTTKADCASALTETVRYADDASHVVKIQINRNAVTANEALEVEKQVTVVTLNDQDRLPLERVVERKPSEIVHSEPKRPESAVAHTDLRLNIEKMVQKPLPACVSTVTTVATVIPHGRSAGVSASASTGAGPGTSSVPLPVSISGNISSGGTTVTELNVSHPSYYYVMSSGQFSPCDTLDSGTGSDLESSNTVNNPLPKAATNGISCGGAPKLELHLKTTKIRVNNAKSAKASEKQHCNGGEHARAGSLTDSEESESSSLSCDSLHSADYVRQSSLSPTAPKPPAAHAKMLSSFLPDSLLRDIRDRKFPTNDFETKYGNGSDAVPPPAASETVNEQDFAALEHVKFLQERNSNNTSVNVNANANANTNKRTSLPGKTFVLNTENGTFVDTKMNSMPRRYEADKYYNFHVNEHENFRSFGNGTSNADDLESLPEYDGKIINDDAFAGYKDIRCGSATSTIRSSKGTVRGVKNRVRNGIATFLQLQQPNVKNYKEKDLGKVVLYTTSMGIIRDTYAKCSNVKQILRTLLVKFEERDVFMSVEYQAEIKERMHSEAIKVPQLFVEGQHIGDADTVERLNESGELRQLLKPYKSISSTYTCQTCGGYRLLPCPSCNGSKKSVHRNHFTAEFVALKCMNCDEVGLVKCHNC